MKERPGLSLLLAAAMALPGCLSGDEPTRSPEPDAKTAVTYDKTGGARAPPINTLEYHPKVFDFRVSVRDEYGTNLHANDPGQQLISCTPREGEIELLSGAGSPLKDSNYWTINVGVQSNNTFLRIYWNAWLKRGDPERIGLSRLPRHMPSPDLTAGIAHVALPYGAKIIRTGGIQHASIGGRGEISKFPIAESRGENFLKWGVDGGLKVIEATGGAAGRALNLAYDGAGAFIRGRDAAYLKRSIADYPRRNVSPIILHRGEGITMEHLLWRHEVLLALDTTEAKAGSTAIIKFPSMRFRNIKGESAALKDLTIEAPLTSAGPWLREERARRAASEVARKAQHKRNGPTTIKIRKNKDGTYKTAGMGGGSSRTDKTKSPPKEKLKMWEGSGKFDHLKPTPIPKFPPRNSKPPKVIRDKKYWENEGSNFKPTPVPKSPTGKAKTTGKTVKSDGHRWRRSARTGKWIKVKD